MSKYKYFNKLCLLIIIRQHMFGKKAIFNILPHRLLLLFSRSLCLCWQRATKKKVLNAFFVSSTNGNFQWDEITRKRLMQFGLLWQNSHFRFLFIWTKSKVANRQKCFRKIFFFLSSIRIRPNEPFHLLQLSEGNLKFSWRFFYSECIFNNPNKNTHFITSFMNQISAARFSISSTP